MQDRTCRNLHNFETWIFGIYASSNMVERCKGLALVNSLALVQSGNFCTGKKNRKILEEKNRKIFQFSRFLFLFFCFIIKIHYISRSVKYKYIKKNLKRYHYKFLKRKFLKNSVWYQSFLLFPKTSNPINSTNKSAFRDKSEIQ